MENQPFIGIGHNPQGKDLPLGFGMRLAQEPQAMQTYAALPQQQKDQIITYIQNCTTSEDAKQRIRQAVHQLKDGKATMNEQP